MKTMLMAATALVLTGTAFAQTYGTDPAATTTTTTAVTPASGSVVQPSNADPERDARGIAVISDPAVVPAGWNGTAGTAMGGPELDPVTGEPVDAETYPACTATVTDNCLQTYEQCREANWRPPQAVSL